MQITVTVPEGEYIVRCAKIRDMTVTALVRELIDTIIEDQLVLAVLDDDGKLHKHARYARRFKEPPAARSADNKCQVLIGGTNA
jgi:hypothetical protein